MERELLDELIENDRLEQQTFDSIDPEYHGILQKALMELKDLQESCEDVTRKKGKWTEYPHEWGDNWQYSEYECSVCHNRVNFNTDYCPNCGAEMEEE